MFLPYPQNYRTNFSESSNYFSSIGATGNLLGSVQIPNVAAALPGGGSVRLVSMGVRIIYEGTELNRAGKIFVGTAAITTAGQCSNLVTGGGSYNVEPLSIITGTYMPTQVAVKASLTNPITTRISNGVFEVNWVPSGVPTYQTYSTQASGFEPYSSSTSAAVIPSSLYHCASGGAGAQSGQNCLVVIIEGDTTSTAVAQGNSYAFEVISHWEVIPVNPLAVAYDLTPSHSSFRELELAMNRMAVLGGFKVSGSTSTLMVPKQQQGFQPRVIQRKKLAQQPLSASRKTKQQQRPRRPTLTK